MTIEIKLSTLLFGLLTLPIFPLWGILYWEHKNEALQAVSVLLFIALTITWLVSPLPLSEIVEAGPSLPTENATIQDVTMRHHSLIPFVPWGWDYTQDYRRVTSEDGEHIWINLETKETVANGEWDGFLRNYNAENLDSETVDIYINE